MEAIFLCGGRGVRYSELTKETPKPLIKIGDLSILEYAMAPYVKYGAHINLATGYMHESFVDYFWKRYNFNNDVTIRHDAKSGYVSTYSPYRYMVPEIRIINTGLETGTGGRIKDIARGFSTIDNDPFCVTYGDGVGDVDISALISQHTKQNKLLTITLVKVRDNFGVVKTNKDIVTDFIEKPERDSYVHAGYMVFSRKVLKYIKTPDCMFEKTVIPQLVKEGQVASYIHTGYWNKMDTAQDHEVLKKDLIDGRLKIG